MRVLMITRKIDRDDWLAGHSYVWARKISEQLTVASGQLKVICLEKGNTEGLEGVEIYSLGKEQDNTRWDRFWSFQILAWRLVRRSDAVFCHQNPEYAIAVWPLCFLFRKRLISWYAHKAVTWKTRLMLACSDVVLTPSRESLRIQSSKIRIVGHGIDTQVFHKSTQAQGVVSEGAPYHIVTIGRISPVKRIVDLIRAIDILVHTRNLAHLRVSIIGNPAVSADSEHLEYLKGKIRQGEIEQIVKILPGVSHHVIPRVYQQADLFVNFSETGSIDKAVLEAMASECPVLTSNPAFTNMLSQLSDLCLVAPRKPDMIAQKIETLLHLNISDRRALGANLRGLVVEQHNLNSLIDKIIAALES